MPRSITPQELHRQAGAFVIVDVRKAPARASSGETIAGSMRRLPFAAEDWWSDFAGKRVAIFCGHGHEVSQAVCGFLNDNGVDALYLEGGFENWKTAGYATAPLGERP